MVRELGRLSPRERQVATLVRDGLTDRQIAERLSITRRTAEWHVEQILGKLGLTSRAQVAARIAHEEALGSQPAEQGRVRHNLPLQATSFIGRKAQLAEIGSLLGTTRLLTLTGVPGVGKTRLAMELGRRLLGSFADGVWFVDLAAVHEEALVERAVASALRIREQPSRGLTESLINQLTNRRLLLMLDNCEHVIEVAASFASLILQSCDGLILLATSREPLRVPGEVNWRVPPLALPEASNQAGSEELSRSEAVDLFVERAQRVAPTFGLAGEKSSVVELCRHLDGVPLAIELAAARASLMSPSEMLDRLEDRFRLLAAGSRTAVGRHQTMEAAVDWSYDLLSPDERELFRRLSVFAGSFSLESAEAVCPSDDLDSSAILGLLAKLVDKSLVVPVGEAAGRIRYRLLDTLRQYGSERLDASGETEQVRRAHFWYFLEVAETASPHFFTDMEPLGRLDAEQDNFRLAFNWADSKQPDGALRLAVRLWSYWNIRGRLIEGRETLVKALAHGRGDLVLRCEALSLVGQFAWYSGDEAAMAEYANQAVALGRTIPAAPGLTRGLFLAGACALSRQDFELAERLFLESIATVDGLGLRYEAFPGMAGRVYVKMQAGDFMGGRALNDELLGTFSEEKSPVQHCILRCVMAIEECSAGDFVRARTLLPAGLRLARRFGFNYWGGVGVRAASYIAVWHHDYEDAWRLFGASQTLRDHVPFSRTWPRGADYLLEPARAALPAERVAALIEEGERMHSASAFDLALAAVVEPVDQAVSG